MAQLKGKPKASQSWLPNQVTYGMDCSDPDPAKWKPFGTEVEAAASTSNKASPRPPAQAG
jgi:hypothetical protein